MAESKPEFKDLLGISRAPEHVQVEGETVPVLEAVQEITNQTGNTFNERNDCGHQSAERFIKFVKERCEELQRISDRSALGLAAEADSSTISELLTLLNTYRSGLARLLQGKCCYHLIQGEYMEVYYYANELENVATKLSNTEFLQDAKSLLSTNSKGNLAGRQVKDDLLKTHSDILQDNLQFMEKLTRNELAIQEYTLLLILLGAHMPRCDFQFSLDLCNRLLEIACDLWDREWIIDMLAQSAIMYSLLGKYQLSYDIMKEMQTLEIKNPGTHYLAVGNFSAVELILGFKLESLQHAQDSLGLALQTKVPRYIACAYGNIGLAFEYMGRYGEAIEPYEECLQIGQEAKNDRVINNGLCNLGRAYQGLGDIEKAKEYFKKAIETPRPPQAYWGDTEEFRFSGDYLLAKLFLEEKNLDEARKQFMEVIKRCEMLRKRIQDSPIKITFNDTQRKPFQCLQHVMLEQGKKLEALVVAEKGRGRDFFDKIEGEFCSQLDSEEVLLDMIKSRSIAVLFISTLEEVGKLCLWFISSEGKLLKQWSIPYTECNDVFTKLCVALYKTQGRHEIEFRGTTEEECSLIDKAFELIKRDTPGNSDANSTNSRQPFKSSSLLDTTGETTTNTGTSFSTSRSREEANVCTQEPLSSEENYTLSDLIDTLSELILSPFRKELEQLVNKRTTNDMPRLLIIPQGKTFNIPFAALKLNGNPLCNHVTIIEAFSFNSFAYSTTESEKRATTGNFENALIVGNPTHPDDLPRAEEEAKSIANFLDVTPLVKDQATKMAVMEQLPSAGLIHFACHGETDGKGLALACDSHTSYKDCHLTAKDVESMELDADLVVLSACHTARGRINSEGVVGLARAFQIAGARSVVTALWAIPDGATEYFMEQFYDNLRHGQPIADAIRTTQVTMLESQGLNDVINWGSFKVFGANAKIM